MKSKNLYIIAGCNGAGKTTASFNILPEILKCKEFVNADEIAKGLSPFNTDSVALEAGRLMLKRIEELMSQNQDFAFETTLSTRSYVSKVRKARELGYRVTLLFYWLDSVDLAKKRVETRVEEGGHNIPEDVIERRYKKGIDNLFNLYLPICDYSMVFDNSSSDPVLIFEQIIHGDIKVSDHVRLSSLKEYLQK
ncbi:zeta toxin family protein [Reichenbachiella versicolor]|uniref:zeta toxin family protein n=1 Tax=Reichenbachiella versicolor TaxID=1821036 RepID=UPI000D6E7901|nr:zeta toxin family protein [Reichenbachiella versicolor]